jgi:hypothetical protein
MGDEILEFANQANAIDLKTVTDYSKSHGLFRRRNYFFLGRDNFLIIKISRIRIPFWGLGKDLYDLFNSLTKSRGNYFFVALVSNKSGWVLSKEQLLSQITDGSISYSANQKQYKIHVSNLLFVQHLRGLANSAISL